MSDPALKSALRELREDLERLRVDLEDAIADIVGIDEDAAEDVLVRENDGSISVDTAELKGLLERLADAPEATADAFREFDQEVDRAWRRFRQALVQHSEMGASP
jgi:hypothetical protein